MTHFSKKTQKVKYFKIKILQKNTHFSIFCIVLVIKLIININLNISGFQLLSNSIGSNFIILIYRFCSIQMENFMNTEYFQ